MFIFIAFPGQQWLRERAVLVLFPFMTLSVYLAVQSCRMVATLVIVEGNYHGLKKCGPSVCQELKKKTRKILSRSGFDPSAYRINIRRVITRANVLGTRSIFSCGQSGN